MTTPIPDRAGQACAAPRRLVRLGLAGAMLAVAATGASADDGGLGGFLSSVFGGVSQPAPPPTRAEPAPAPRSVPRHAARYGAVRYDATRYDAAPVFRPARARTLVVRLRPARPRLLVAQSPTKPGKVSIYEDRTLRRGDAVMTMEGVRVFAGSTSWPYRSGDFVALGDARIDRGTLKVLAQIDRLPRG